MSPWPSQEGGQSDAFGLARVLAADNLVDEVAIAGEIVEVAGPAHQQRISSYSRTRRRWPISREGTV